MLLLCIVYAALQVFAFRWLVSFADFTLFLDAFSDAVFFIVLSIFLHKAILFGNYVTLGFFQRFVNYLALGFLAISIWTGLSLLSSYLLIGKENLTEVWPMLPMKVFIAMFVYILIVQLIHHQIENNVQEEDEEISPEITEDVEVANETLDRVVVKIGQKIHVVNVPDIIYIQSDGDYVQIYTQGGHFLKEETMKFFESHLLPSMFVRVHRSYIVNVEKILRIELYEKKNRILTLSNGDKIKSSASGYKLLQEALNL